ncbi:VOC family protein [Paralimibaculum aggregatum]|uniref:VOC family protein n=1 Tax=Paralimibaculum aggregatum TaxID=3036245 RepID=A0ABQ6LHJ5_9RHOB|nr:VOC family protein [Limibaculum sp. NKW23]GMG82757.1 VOC family protein [Limibaculum sp. NKW23]
MTDTDLDPDPGQGRGRRPAGGFAPLVAELLVEDLAASLGFWSGPLGFTVAYDRPAERFAYLERPEGGQIMLHQRCGVWETGALARPFGRGVMFQIAVAGLEPIIGRLEQAGWPLHAGPREAWRRIGDREGGRREIAVLDPDGYLLMLAEDLGSRPLRQTP